MLKYFLVLAFLLITLFLRFFLFYQNQPYYKDGQHISFETTLLSEPKIVGNQQRMSANLDGGNRILISISLYPQFHYGDTLHIYGVLKDKVLKNGNTVLVMYFPKIETVKDNKNLFLAVASFIRQKAISLFEKTLPATSSGLLLGIVFGVEESLPIELADSLRISGVFHVVAASGMNVAFVGGFLSSIFGFFLNRQMAIVLSIIGILFYAVLAGLEPSILRASIMGILVFTGQIIGRQNLSLYGLFLAGFAMLFWSPNIIFDIGFQLSFLATAGLLYIRPLFERSKKVKVILNRSVVGEGVVTTIAAQAATLPILVSNFGSYSLWSIVANALVLWTIPTLMVVGGVGVMIGMILKPLGGIFLYLSLPFLLYLEKVISVFASFRGVVNLDVFPWQFTLSYYSFLIAFVLSFKRRK